MKNINDLISDNVSLISRISIKFLFRQEDELLIDINRHLYDVFGYLVNQRGENDE